MKKSISYNELKKMLRESIVKEGVPAEAPADPAAEMPADPAAAPAPAPVDPAIVALVQQLATACGLQVTDPNAAAPADPAAAPAEPAPAPVAERAARLRKIREARRRRLARKA